ncbi:MAG: hypothetical protein LC664_01785 [Flavobacteriales bacterium]|nr:hypothetical protein [Flavobacteriales bacterium]
MELRAFLLISFLVAFTGVKAQWTDKSDVMILGGACELMPYQNKLKPDFSVDARRTLFQKRWIAVMGLKFGAEYRRVHRMGIGVYFLNSRVFDSDFEFDIAAGKVEYEFRYTTLYYDRVLFFNRKWEVGATLHLGGGKVRPFFQNPDNPNDRIAVEPIDFSTVELAVYGEYNVLYWIGVGAGIGHRGVFGAGKSLNKEFSAPIFVANLQLKLFKLARSFYDESAKNEF